MGIFECELMDGGKYKMTGVVEVNSDGGMLRIVTKTFTHFVPTEHIKKYTISF